MTDKFAKQVLGYLRRDLPCTKETRDEALKVAMKALDLMIPKNPINEEVTDGLFTCVCPTCGEPVNMPVCSECFQRLTYMEDDYA